MAASKGSSLRQSSEPWMPRGCEHTIPSLQQAATRREFTGRRIPRVSFFAPVEDEVFGYRLHDLDLAVTKLAVTKVLAMAGRREARDYYDVIKLHQAGKKLTMLAGAAPAKDPAFTPELILDEINRHSNYSASELQAEFADAEPRAVKKILLEATHEARVLFARLPLE